MHCRIERRADLTGAVMYSSCDSDVADDVGSCIAGCEDDNARVVSECVAPPQCPHDVSVDCSAVGGMGLCEAADVTGDWALEVCPVLVTQSGDACA